MDIEQPATYATESVVKVEAEFSEVRDGIFELIDKNLMPSAGAGNSKEVYFMMKGDHYRYVEDMAAMPVPQVMEEIMEFIRLVPHERIRERIVEETIDVPVPQVMKEIVKPIPQDKVQNRTAVPVRVSERFEEQVDVPVPEVVEQIIDVPVSQMMEDIIEVVKHISEERAQKGTVDNISLTCQFHGLGKKLGV